MLVLRRVGPDDFCNLAESGARGVLVLLLLFVFLLGLVDCISKNIACLLLVFSLLLLFFFLVADDFGERSATGNRSDFIPLLLATLPLVIVLFRLLSFLLRPLGGLALLLLPLRRSFVLVCIVVSL